MPTIVWLLLTAAVSLTAAPRAEAGCGCDKPPPPRAAVRPFVAHADQTITIFDDRLVEGQRYDVQFISSVDFSNDWSRGKVRRKRDLADRQERSQLRVAVGDVAFGPVWIVVWRNGTFVFALSDDAFTVTSRPIEVHDIEEVVTRQNYRAGIGKDGTVYIPVDVRHVSRATTFVGRGSGFPLAFGAESVAMYNDQGFLMQLLNYGAPGAQNLFAVTPGDDDTSVELRYWRHEFRTYKTDHRQKDYWGTDNDPEWHADGTPHINHDHIVLAIRGTLPDGNLPRPGATPPFQLTIESLPDGQ
jgi:hypothetical protein